MRNPRAAAHSPTSFRPRFPSLPRHCAGVASRHEGVDIVIIRENTEGEYSGMEHEVYPGVTESLKVMTREGTRR